MDIPTSAGLPLFGIAMLTVLFTVCFCCYMCRLKCMNLEEKEARQGFRVVHHDTTSEKCPQQCPVCLEDFRKKSTLAITHCDHAFHYRCLIKWLSESNSCPLCMGQVGNGWEANDQLVANVPMLAHVV